MREKNNNFVQLLHLLSYNNLENHNEESNKFKQFSVKTYFIW